MIRRVFRFSIRPKRLSEKARIGNEKSGARTLKDFCTAIGVS